jgi:YD repeat-containing protein
VRTVANFVGNGTPTAANPDQNVTVEMTYHTSGQVATLTARNLTTGNQVTTYEYNGLGQLFREWYPDAVASVEYTYNRQGEVLTKRDQNGSIHTYDYDDLGRLLHDRITTLGTGVDGAVRRISTVYDVVGNVRSVTSFNNAAVGQGTVLNQVAYEFDNHGLLSRESSNATGAVVQSTPHVLYTYNVTQANGFFTRQLLPATLRYPALATIFIVVLISVWRGIPVLFAHTQQFEA